MRHKANFDVLFLKKLNKNNKFVFNDVVANDELKNL